MSRKYRQHGYMDYEQERKKKRRDEFPIDKHHRSGPIRTTVRVFKCYLCGNEIDPNGIQYDSICPKCNADLRSCVHCGSFDPSSHFQCLQNITESVSPKDKRNNCKFFNCRTSVEKRIATYDTTNDARAAFEKLFNK